MKLYSRLITGEGLTGYQNKPKDLVFDGPLRTKLTNSVREPLKEFLTETREQLLKGTSLNSENSSIGLGTVLLTDIEFMGAIKKNANYNNEYEGTPPHRSRYIQYEADLLVRPSSLFVANSQRKTLKNDREQIVVYPYIKIIPNTEIHMAYGRGVLLACTVPDKNGMPRLKAFPSWGDLSSSPIVGESTRFAEHRIEIPQNIAIGDTYRINEKGAVMRIRSAEVCVQGIFKAVKAKKKKRSLSLLGRTAATPSFT